MKFSNGNLSEGMAHALFEQTFGKMGVSHEMTYHAPLQNVKKNISGEYGDKMMKAWEANVTKAPTISTTTGGTFTEQSMMPSFIDSEIFDLVMRDNPLVGSTTSCSCTWSCLCVQHINRSWQCKLLR